MANWKTLSSEVVYETAWMKIHRDEVLNQNGKPLTYSYMELQNASVFIVAMNDQQQVLLQSVYRYTRNTRFWEIPAGFMDPNEDAKVSAMRELKEETGLVSDHWHHLGRIHQILGIGRAPLEVYLARNVHPEDNPTDQEKDITHRTFVSMKEIESMIANGELVDSPVIAAIYMARIYNAKEEKAKG